MINTERNILRKVGCMCLKKHWCWESFLMKSLIQVNHINKIKGARIKQCVLDFHCSLVFLHWLNEETTVLQQSYLAIKRK